MSEPNLHVLGELSGYLDRTLSPAETKRIEAHLKTCGGCERHYTELRALREMLQTGPTYTPPESFYQGVLRRIEKPSRESTRWSWNLSAKALASACLILIVVWVSHESRKEKTAALAPAKDVHVDKIISIPFAKAKEDKAPMAPSLQELAALKNPRAAPAPQFEPQAGIAGGGQSKEGTLQYKNSAPSGELASRSFGGSRQLVEAPTPRRQTFTPSPAESSLAAAQSIDSEAKNVSADTKKQSRKDEAALESRRVKGIALQDIPMAAAPIPQQAQWKGASSAIKTPRTVIIENVEDWRALWREHNPDSSIPVPTIDFTQNIAAAVFSGEQPEGHDVEITDVKQTPTALIVEYREISPPPQAVRGSLVNIVHPYHIKVIPKTNLLIQFKKL